MADKGIIFSAPMVRALLAGRKTQTRRLLSLREYRTFSEFGPSTTTGYDWHFRRADAAWCDFRAADLPLPYAVGDRLYVREANDLHDEAGSLIRRHVADGTKLQWSNREQAAWIEEYSRNHCPSIHMPRWASRLWLEVTDVRVQRLQAITEEDARAEGAEFGYGEGAKISQTRMFELLWDSLHTTEGQRWDDDPWIVAVSFNVHHGNIDKQGATA
jgi:hypothetical protein